MTTQNDYVEQMRMALSVSEPDLNTQVGTTIRKIIDAVAEVASEVSVDKYLLDYQYDIDTKQGKDLEDFVRLFGFSRLPAKRAVGVVTFARTTAATENIILPVNLQVATHTAPPVIFQTVVPAVLMAGTTSVDLPVQAVAGGSAGNVSAGAIDRFVNPIAGITSFINAVAITGGVDPESDDQLRDRFRKTIFRNLAGTEAMFLGVALDHDAVTQANVVGSVKHRIEQVEIVGGNATSTVQDARYVYADSVLFGPDIIGGDILIPSVHYSFNSTVPPSISALDVSFVPDGIYDLEFDYVPLSSRNLPDDNITNRIDLYVNGIKPEIGVETRAFDIGLTFNDVTGSPLDRSRYRRVDGSQAVAGNFFLDLAHGPVLDPAINNVIVIGPNQYAEGTDFFLVNDISPEGGTSKSRAGLEWVSLGNGAPQAIPANGTHFTVMYTFNAVPREVATALRDWRLLCTDVEVHQAKTLLLNIYLVAILQSGFSAASVLPTIEFDLRALLDNIGFDGTLQTSDILSVVSHVAGVDAVRFVTSNDHATNFAIQEVSQTGSVLRIHASSDVPRRALDVSTGDDEVVALNSVVITIKAENTFGTV